MKPAELDDYIQSLPSAARPARDQSARRQRLLPALRTHAARAQRRVRRRRILWRAVGGATLAGASAAAALWISLPVRKPQALSAVAASFTASAAPAAAPAALTVLDGAVLLEAAGVARTLRAGDSFGLTGVGALEAAADRPPVRVQLSAEVGVTLAPAARVRPIATGASRDGAPAALEVLALERGGAHFQVKKLGDARRFHVLTADADVEVRGTAFDVSLRPGAPPLTCVSVSEGLVLVASGLTSRLLAAGESWGCGGGGEVGAGTGTGTGANGGDTTATRTRVRTTTMSRSTSTAGSGRRGGADLGEQNRLFQAALAAERAGEIAEAARRYRQLLTLAPDGPLATQARANLAAVSGAPR